MTARGTCPPAGHGVASLDARHQRLRSAVLARLDADAGGDGELCRRALRAVVDISPHDPPEDSLLNPTTRDAVFYRAGQLAILDQLLLTVASLPPG
jgi:hypothetical protein